MANTFIPKDTKSVLEDLPPYHSKLLDYGERPYWSPDGTRIAFIEQNYGDVCEMDFETREVRNLTGNLGDHHDFLRVLFLSNGDYLLIGPKEFKDRDISRHVESELWVMDKAAKTPPVPLGRRMFEGAGVSTIAPRLTYAVSGRNDPSIGDDHAYECHVTDIEYGPDGPRLGVDTVVYRASGGRRPEPQDFRHDDREVIMAEYVRDQDSAERRKCIVKGVEIETGAVRTYIDEQGVHNECEGIFPDHEHICLESACDTTDEIWKLYPRPMAGTTDLWKLKLDGSGRRARLTHFFDRVPWRASNSNVSPDGRWLAFMVNFHGDEAGYGRGLALLDLEGWQTTVQAEEWDVAPVSED